jgi:hypothetical protein
MCKKCDTLRRQIAATRTLSTGLTDPTSIVLNKADIKALEESLMRVLAKHHPFGK